MVNGLLSVWLLIRQPGTLALSQRSTLEPAWGPVAHGLDGLSCTRWSVRHRGVGTRLALAAPPMPICRTIRSPGLGRRRVAVCREQEHRLPQATGPFAWRVAQPAAQRAWRAVWAAVRRTAANARTAQQSVKTSNKHGPSPKAGQRRQQAASTDLMLR